MITNDQELQTTSDRISWFQNQVAQLRRSELNASNFHAASAGFLSELDKLQRSVREYLSHHPTELSQAA